MSEKGIFGLFFFCFHPEFIRHFSLPVPNRYIWVRKPRIKRVMVMEQWRFLNTGKSSPEVNMAIDEAILIAHSQGLVPPTVRFYGWDPPTLSIGYFQRVDRDVDIAKLRQRGLGFVRRATGGRAVLHDRELTYSVVVAEDHPLMPGSVVEAYRVISKGLVEGFRRLGLCADMVSLAGDEERQKFGSPGSAACFDSPSWYELVVEGRKVAGSAQLRQKGVILQHGSILQELDADRLFEVLRFPTEELRRRMRESFEERAVPIHQLREPVTWEEMVQAFYDGFAAGLGVRLVEGELTPEEKRLAAELARRYASEEWNFRR
jgi:lipoate-protein ligase A